MLVDAILSLQAFIWLHSQANSNADVENIIANRSLPADPHVSGKMRQICWDVRVILMSHTERHGNIGAGDLIH